VSGVHSEHSECLRGIWEASAGLESRVCTIPLDLKLRLREKDVTFSRLQSQTEERVSWHQMEKPKDQGCRESLRQPAQGHSELHGGTGVWGLQPSSPKHSCAPQVPSQEKSPVCTHRTAEPRAGRISPVTPPPSPGSLMAGALELHSCTVLSLRMFMEHCVSHALGPHFAVNEEPSYCPVGLTF
jgi:hypothetical protein